MMIFRFLGNLLRAVWRGLDTLRRVLHLVLLVGLFVLLLAGVLGQPAPVPSSAALVLDPSGTLVDQLEGHPLDRAIAELQGLAAPQTLLPDLVTSLEQAATDDRIELVVLRLDGLEGGGLAKLQTLGAAIDRFRESGKKVIAVGDSFTRDQYYVAVHADEVIMHGLGIVWLDGYEYYRTFLKDALDKLRVDMNVFRVGEYKSFVEPFLRNDMSEEDKEASRRWLSALWRVWQQDVVKARGIEPAVIDRYANALPELLAAAGGNGAQAALEAGLIDRILGRAEANEYLTGLVGESTFEDGAYSAVDFRSYVDGSGLPVKLPALGRADVAVVVAAGDIVDGEAQPGLVGGDTLAAELRRAREDDSIEAVVLRVDSPGGSMFASEVILEELLAVQAAGKPVVASMSSVAASGGYYIAMPADEIWASEATITGSIGVGAIVPTVQRGLDALGVHVDGIGTTELAGQMRLDRPLGDDARRLLDLSVADAYRIFVSKVAEARDLSPERAERIARGRVWIGSDAKELGLVDEIGGLEQAIESAARRAGLAEGTWGVRYMEPDLSLTQRVLLGLARSGLRMARRPDAAGGASAMPGLVRAALGALRREVRRFDWLNDPRGLYYHCLCVPDL